MITYKYVQDIFQVSQDGLKRFMYSQARLN